MFTGFLTRFGRHHLQCSSQPQNGEPRIHLGIGAGAHSPSIDLSLSDARKHLLMTGATGSGIRIALESLLLQHTRLGLGYVMVDPQPDRGLCERLRAAADAAGRADDFLALDFDEVEPSFSFDALEGCPLDVASELLQLAPPSEEGDEADRWRAHAHRGLAVIIEALRARSQSHTLNDVAQALTDCECLFSLERALPDALVARQNLQDLIASYRAENGTLELPQMLSQLGGWVSELASITERPQGHPTRQVFPLSDVLTHNMLCYVALPVMNEGATARGLGRFLTSKLMHLIQARSSSAEGARRDPLMVVFEGLPSYYPRGLEAAFSQARALDVSLVASTNLSALKLLPSPMKAALLENTSTKLIFRVSTPEESSEVENLIPEAVAGSSLQNSFSTLKELQLGHFIVIQGQNVAHGRASHPASDNKLTGNGL